MILYFMRRGDRLLICDKELFENQDEEITIGFPLFRLEAKGQQEKGMISKRCWER